jgi:carbon-monoxide dehydrogenase medium subunit
VSGTFDGASVTALRVVVGAVSGRPQWFPAITDKCLGAALSEDAIGVIADGYAEAVDPVDDIRGSADYRRHVVQAQVARALRLIVGREAA